LDSETKFRIDSTQLQRYEHGALNRIVCDRIAQGSGMAPAWRSFDGHGRFRLKPYHYGSLKNSMDSGLDLNVDSESGSGFSEKDDIVTRHVGSLTYMDFICKSVCKIQNT
jgi:hypothetical protein